MATFEVLVLRVYRSGKSRRTLWVDQEEYRSSEVQKFRSSEVQKSRPQHVKGDPEETENLLSCGSIFSLRRLGIVMVIVVWGTSCVTFDTIGNKT